MCFTVRTLSVQYTTTSSGFPSTVWWSTTYARPSKCLALAGERAGLPGDMAARLARQTVAGAGALLAQSPKSATELREEVTSPGGTTQAGLAVLVEEGRLNSAFADAVSAAAARSRELAG